MNHSLSRITSRNGFEPRGAGSVTLPLHVRRILMPADACSSTVESGTSTQPSSPPPPAGRVSTLTSTLLPPETGMPARAAAPTSGRRAAVCGRWSPAGAASACPRVVTPPCASAALSRYATPLTATVISVSERLVTLTVRSGASWAKSATATRDNLTSPVGQRSEWGWYRASARRMNGKYASPGSISTSQYHRPRSASYPCRVPSASQRPTS